MNEFIRRFFPAAGAAKARGAAGEGASRDDETADETVEVVDLASANAALAEEVAERKKAELRLRAQHGVALVLAASTRLREAAPRILQCVCENLGWDFGAIWARDKSGGLRCVDLWPASDASLAPFATVSRETTFAAGVGLPGRVWATRSPLWIADVVHDANFPRAPYAASVGLHGAFAVPILLGGDEAALGTLEFLSREVRQPDDEVLEAVATVGRQIGQFIERRWARDALARSEQELSDSFENAPVGLHWVGPDSTILRANQAELDMLGYARDEYVGHPIGAFHVDPVVATDILAHLRAGETIRGRRARMRRKDGSVVQVRIDANALFEDGELVHTRTFTRDVTERVRAEAALRESEERFRLMVEGVRDYAVHSVGLDGRITSWNAGAQRLHGWRAEEVLGADFGCLYLPSDRATRLPQRTLKEVAQRGQGQYEGWRLRKDGTRFWAENVWTALRDEEGRLKGYSRLARDVTERRRTAVLLRRAAEIEAESRRVQETSRLEAQFLAALSRDLKSPLDALADTANLLAGSAESDAGGERQAHAEELADGLRHVSGVLDRMLGHVRGVPGWDEVRAEPVDIGRLVAETREILLANAGARSVRLEVEVDPAVAHLDADPAKMRLVLYNLLAHAVGITPSAGRIAVRAEPEGSEAMRIEVAIEGSTVAPDELRRAFDVAPSGAARPAGGDPRPGLVVARRIVEAHGGRVGARAVEGASGGGAVIFAVLPREARAAPEAGAGATDPDATAAPGEPPGILVVDDDVASRAWLSWTLSGAGWTVVTATEASDAVAVSCEREFDAVAVNLLLADAPAHEVVRGIRGEAPRSEGPAVVITVPGDKEGVAGLRVDDLLARPPPTDALFAALDRLSVTGGPGRPVLVLEADPALREAVETSVRALGHSTATAGDSDTALRAVAESRPAAVVVGLSGAGADVFEFLRHLRRMPAAHATPVLLCAGREGLDASGIDALRAAAQAAVLEADGGAAILREVQAIDARAGHADPSDAARR